MPQRRLREVLLMASVYREFRTRGVQLPAFSERGGSAFASRLLLRYAYPVADVRRVTGFPGTPGRPA